MCSHFFTSTQCQILCCYTDRLLYAGAAQGELPVCVSVNCEKAEEATQRYPDCRSPYFAAVAGLWSAPGYPRERGDSQEGGNRRCLPLLCARAASAQIPLASQAPPMSTIIKIDKYPQKGYTNLTRGYGGIGRRARFRFWCPRRAGSSPVTRTSKKTLWNLSTAFFF